jgi:hypothetical protein
VGHWALLVPEVRLTERSGTPGRSEERRELRVVLRLASLSLSKAPCTCERPHHSVEHVTLRVLDTLHCARR